MDLPLTSIFIDCDSFFASCEQHLNPALLERPIAVAPVMAETSCCIAASYEAKAHGVKTGTSLKEARELCPDIVIVPARPSEYVKIHHRVVAAVESCIHVEEVLSIDEMWAWLPYNWRERGFVENLGRKIKDSVMNTLSPAVKVSVGIAPNQYLAKMASKMRKPDGLFIIEGADLPQVLHELELSDFHGVGRNMEARLRASGVQTSAELCAAPKERLHVVWGSHLGDRLWFLLRGEEIAEIKEKKPPRTIGHSHVLPPERRAPDKAYPVLCKLLHKAAERLRSHGMVAQVLQVGITYTQREKWRSEISFAETDVTLHFMKLVSRIWRQRPHSKRGVLKLGVTLLGLSERANFTPDLFMDSYEEKYQRADAAIDELRARYGRQSVYLGVVQECRESAPMRIAFNHIPELDLEKDSM